MITLTTDFGLRDEYVGVMKGVIAGISPGTRVVDVCHHIDPQDVVHGAFILAAAYSYFPSGTVHVAVVDPGVGGMRRILAVTFGGHLFVVPDNGLLERVLENSTAFHVVAVTNTKYYLETMSQTFHGRDIFAPVAAHLSNGLPMVDLGPAVDPSTLMTGIVPRYRFLSKNCIQGSVVAVDRFGNLMTNIDIAAINRLARQIEHRTMLVELAGTPIGGLVAAYNQVAKDSPLAIVGSRNLMEISVNCGNARLVLNAEKGDYVLLREA